MVLSLSTATTLPLSKTQTAVRKEAVDLAPIAQEQLGRCLMRLSTTSSGTSCKRHQRTSRLRGARRRHSPLREGHQSLPSTG